MNKCMSNMNKCMSNIKKLSDNCNIYVIMKENRIYGKIYARFTEASCHLSFLSYFDDIPNVYKKASGYGYNKLDKCMEEIFDEFSENFTKYGIIFDPSNYYWKYAIENAGYNLVFVI